MPKVLLLVLLVAMGATGSAMPSMEDRIEATKQYLLDDERATFDAAATPTHPYGTDVAHANITCSKCKEYVTMVTDIIKSPTGWNFTKALIASKCETKYSNSTKDMKACLVVAKVAEHLAVWMYHKMAGYAWDMPVTFCADVVQVCHEPCCTAPDTPEQIRINYAHQTDLSQMRVTWVTLNPTQFAAVTYWVAGQPSTSWTSYAVNRTYTKGGWVGTIHMATMTSLKPGTTYTYWVGAGGHLSQQYNFTTAPANIGTKARPFRLLMLADMGYGPNSNNTVALMTQKVLRGEVDLIMHPGDISYADLDEHHWDLYFRKIEPIAARVPYMTGPGNHEHWWNFTAYRVRCGMSMPGEGADGKMYYSLKVGTVQFFMLDTETWTGGGNIRQIQRNWAMTEFPKANAQRSQVPWIVSLHHHPLYCTCNASKWSVEDCGVVAHHFRNQIEGLYIDTKVDINLVGHMHDYERMYPTKYSEPTQFNYTNPSATTYIVNGAAGQREGNETPHPSLKPWSAFGSKRVGFSMIEFVSDFEANEHTLDFKFLRSKTGEVVDHFTIKKNL